MSILIEQLKGYWASTGVKLGSGVAEKEIEAFEAKYGIYMPEDFRNYFRLIGGMEKEGESDDSATSFWPSESIKSVPERLVQFAGIPDYSRVTENLKEPQFYFVFADWMMWSQVYAIRLTAKRDDENHMMWICGSEHCYIIAKSFSEFINNYLQDPESILVPKELA